MTETAFFDTNVLVYVHDPRSPQKQQVARDLVKQYFSTGAGVLSTQVLQELFVFLTAKIANLPVPAVASLIADYCAFPLVIIEPAHILNAVDLHARYQLSFWDGLILAAAKAAGASTLFSEDFSHGRTYDGVTLQNPFIGERS